MKIINLEFFRKSENDLFCQLRVVSPQSRKKVRRLKCRDLPADLSLHEASAVQLEYKYQCSPDRVS